MSDRIALPRRSTVVAIFSAVVSIFRWGVLAAILLLLAPYLFAYFDNPRGYFLTDTVIRQRDAVLSFVTPRIQAYIPTRIDGKDRTDLILVGGLLLVAVVAGSIRKRVQRRSLAKQMRLQVRRWKEAGQLKDNSPAGATLEKLSNFEKAGSVDRNELLRTFAETKKKLDALGREVAFLSIDVVGSTTMKQNEERAAVQYDFGEYRNLVEAVFKARGVLKAAWTPDGVMACFPHVDDAVQAGKDVIIALDDFNKHTKLMKQDFAVRCGVNAGYVHFDDATPMEAMSDRVIDIAGHMQKYAEPNTVTVARKVIEPLRNPEGFEPTTKVVDGYEVARWAPRRA